MHEKGRRTPFESLEEPEKRDKLEKRIALYALALAATQPDRREELVNGVKPLIIKHDLEGLVGLYQKSGFSIGLEENRS